MAVKTFMNLPGGLRVPRVGLGTGQLQQEEVVEKTLSAAIELGYRHFDTAFAYRNEVSIGSVLKKWFSSGKLKREDVFITTKLPLPGVNENRVEMFMKKSLENLQLDYVDLYLVHFPIGTKYVEDEQDPSQPEIDTFDHIEIWKKMEEQVAAGRTKTIGLSNFNQRQIERILKSAKIKPACLQVELHVDLQQRDLVKFCHENGIVVVAYSPLGSPGRRTIEPRSANFAVILHNKTIKKIADKHKKTSAQVMLRYLLQKDIVVIPKTSNPARLQENISVFDFALDPEDVKTLDDLDAGEKGRLARFNFVPGLLDHPEYPFKT